MKFLVLSVFVSAASAQPLFGLVQHPNGAVVPLDEPAVITAKANHFAAKGLVYGASHLAAVSAPLSYAAYYGYSAPLNLNTQLIGHPNGAIVPVDEPAVALARSEHLAAKGAVYAAGTPLLAATSPYGYAANYGYAGPLNLNTQLIGHPNGAVVPVDEPAVAAARAEHLAAKGAVYAANTPIFAAVPHVAAPLVAAPLTVTPFNYAANYGYAGPLNLNTQLIGHPNGAVVPVDEPAVVFARAEHLAAKGAVYADNAPIFAAVPSVAAPLVAAPLAQAPLTVTPFNYAANYGYAGPLNLNTQLIGHPNGAVVPVDEPAVAFARAEHLAAKGAVYAANAPIFAAVPRVAAPLVAAPLAPAPLTVPPFNYAANYSYAGPLNLNTQLIAHPNGAVVPVDEPAVALARAEHLATKGVYGGVYAPVVDAISASQAVYAPYAPLVAHPNGAIVPVDEPAVAKARAEHLSLFY